MSKPVVLITGALTGIGRATAFAFAKEGARVVVSPRPMANDKISIKNVGRVKVDNLELSTNLSARAPAVGQGRRGPTGPLMITA